MKKMCITKCVDLGVAKIRQKMIPKQYEIYENEFGTFEIIKEIHTLDPQNDHLMFLGSFDTYEEAEAFLMFELGIEPSEPVFVDFDQARII